MTRINCVPVEQLSREHLIAEYRELPRIFGMVRGMIERGVTDPKLADIPSSYRMGTGHMKFFTDKLGWCVQRQKLLILEMRRRGYQPNFDDTESLLQGIPEAFHGSWSPTNRDLEISWARIRERLNAA
jgi:hypothetical protein